MLAKPPEALNLEDRTHQGKNWKQFKRDWTYYEITAKINKEDGAIRVAHLLNVVGKDGQELYETFTLSEEDSKNISKVLKAFEARCVAVEKVIYEHYMFNKRTQEVGENIQHFITDVLKLAENCQYGDLKDDLIRDKSISGITDDRVREKLLGTRGLNLETAIETLRTNQAIKYRMRDMGGMTTSESTNASDTVNAVKHRKSKKNESRGQPRTPQSRRDHQADDNTPPPVTKACKFCSKQHEFKRGLCPASDKNARNVGKKTL